MPETIAEIKARLLAAAAGSASARSEARGGAARVSALRAQFEKTIKSQAMEKAELERRAPLPSHALRTEKLWAANCHNSKNPLVRNIWSDVQRYRQLGDHKLSTMSAGDIANRVRILDSIMVGCATYMSEKFYRETKRSGSGTARRKQRYDAFDELLADAASELSQLGARALHRPDQFRNTFVSPSKLNVNYWLERLDPRHRPGFVISYYYKDWSAEQLRRETTDPNSTETFFEFIDRMAKALPQNDVINFYHITGYDPNDTRSARRLHFSGKDRRLQDNWDTNFDTGRSTTVASGQGWAIFVCSMPICGYEGGPVEHMLFSGSHIEGSFYHASFLGGAPVLAAGEWMVVDGQIKVITGKSGHYKTTPQNMLTFLRTCLGIPGDAICRPDFNSTEYYRVQDLRQHGLGAPPVDPKAAEGIINSGHQGHVWVGRTRAPADPGLSDYS